MMRIVVLLALSLTLGMGACGKKADAQVTCEGCQAKVDKTETVEMNGKSMCKGCAADHTEEMSAKAAAEAETVVCAGGCGMEMVATDAQIVSGQYYCAGCAADAE